MSPADNPIYAYLPFLAILAPFALFWGQLKMLITKFFGIFVVRTDFTALGYTVFNNFLATHAKKYRLAQFNFSAEIAYTTTDKKHLAVGYEAPSGMPQVYKIGKTLFMAKAGVDKENHTHMLMIYSLRWTMNPEKIYLKALKEYNNGMSQRRSFKIMYKSGMGKRQIINSREEGYNPMTNEKTSYDHWISNRLLEYRVEEIGYRDRTKINSGYVFSKNAQTVVNECESWRRSEDWYKERGILWRRGIILVGAAGTGKSSLVRKICQINDIPLIIFDLSSMSNTEMIESWKDIQQYSPCAVLFDDIDRVFEGNTNVAGEQGGGLTLDCLLGCISGAMPAEGVLVFATVNDPTKLDPALGVVENGRPTRPGRFDMIVELGNQSEGDRRTLAKMIFENLTVDIEKVVKQGDGMTAAQFNDHCSRVAVDIYWRQKNELDKYRNPNKLG